MKRRNAETKQCQFLITTSTSPTQPGYLGPLQQKRPQEWLRPKAQAKLVAYHTSEF